MRAVTTDAFTDALESVRGMRVRADFALEEAPAPQRLAPDAFALTVEPADEDIDSFSGRFVLLHDPDGQDEWGGTFRVVIFTRADVDRESIHDPVLAEAGWSWLTESLQVNGAACSNLGGTVTWSSGTGFGTLSDRGNDDLLEIRASWTPVADGEEVAQGLDAHVQAWIDVIAHMAGLPPMPAGMSSVGRRAPS